MGTALTVIVMYSLSVLIIRVATVSLQLTGLSAGVAKFQALSAFSGAGYTTNESELIVNFPIRRKIISYLVVLGNLGLTAILATLVVGFVNTDGELKTILLQFGWIIGSVAVMWFLILNPIADKFMCRFIHKILISTTELGKLSYSILMQLDDGWEIGEHKVTYGALSNRKIKLQKILICLECGELIFVRFDSGESQFKPNNQFLVEEGHTLIILAPKQEHQALYRHMQTINIDNNA